MVETAEMPMTASRQKKEGGLGLFVVQHLLDHEELVYQFDKRLWAYASVWNCPKILKNKKIESGTEIGNSLEFDFVVPPPHS